MQIKEKVRNIVENNGIQVDENEEFLEMDSIAFVQVIIDLELEFAITIPDEFLRDDIYPNLESLEAVVQEVLSQKNGQLK